MKKLTILIAAALIAGTSQAAPLKKCVDDKGRTYYGDAIPPEVLDKCRTSSELSERGVERKKTRHLTADEIKMNEKAKEEEEARAKLEQQKALEQKRRDKALIDSYTNEKEIDLARDRNLLATQANIDGTQMRIKSVQGRLDGLQKQAERFTKNKKPIPADLSTEIRATEDEIKKLQENIARHQQEREATKARFEEEKKRFRELRGSNGRQQ